MLDDIIQNMTVFHDDEYFNYRDICAKWMSDCFQNNILNLDYIMDEVNQPHLVLQLQKIIQCYFLQSFENFNFFGN